MIKSSDSKARLREPLQIYITADERRLLDSLAGATGLSRAEILRRGMRSFAAERAGPSPLQLHTMSILPPPTPTRTRSEQVGIRRYVWVARRSQRARETPYRSLGRV